MGGEANYVRCTNYVRSANYGELRPSLESALPQNTPDFEFSSWIFSFKLDFFPLFEIWENFFHLNFISIKKEKKSEKLFLTTKNPRFSNFKSDFFPIEKVFSQIFENTEIFFHLK